MLKNYITIAVRHLFRHKLFSIIMVCCLAIGITFSLIIGLYIRNQERVNSTISDVGNQYCDQEPMESERIGHGHYHDPPVGQDDERRVPQAWWPIITAIILSGQLYLCGQPDKYFKDSVAICDTTLVSMYGFPVLYGDQGNAFPTISSAVITESVAMKWFGEEKR